MDGQTTAGNTVATTERVVAPLSLKLTDQLATTTALNYAVVVAVSDNTVSQPQTVNWI